MPTYQYACTDVECGNRFELVQSFTDPAASECPVCSHAVRKVYGSVGVVFKGSGFYRTDSRAAAEKSRSSSAAGKSDSNSNGTSDSKSTSDSTSSKSDTKSGSKSDAGSGSSSDSKPAAKSTSSAPAAASA